MPTRDRTCSLGEIEEPIDGLTLDLGLTLDDDPTMNGREVPLRNRHGEARGDVRSVYEVGREADERQIRNRSC